MLKKFQIEWNGQPEEIEYEDDIPFGEVEKILKSCVQANVDEQFNPQIDVPSYRIQIVASALRKAPFAIKSVAALEAVPHKLGRKIIGEIIKDYPLVSFLKEWMETVLGQNLMQSQQPLPNTPT